MFKREINGEYLIIEWSKIEDHFYVENISERFKEEKCKRLLLLLFFFLKKKKLMIAFAFRMCACLAFRVA